MPLLNVNIDHIATIRQARRADEPDPVWAAVQCQLAGANGITVHLRQDRRHINDRDVRLLKEVVSCKFNLEMSLSDSIVRIAERIRPDQVTLVPENRAELTTEGGLDCTKPGLRLSRVVGRMHRKGILVSAFILPDEKQILACARAGCDAVELHTGPYANARTAAAVERALNRLCDAGDIAASAGLVVHAGHGLTYRNVRPAARIEGLCELNIGHSIVSRAVMTGLRSAVEEMTGLIANP